MRWCGAHHKDILQITCRDTHKRVHIAQSAAAAWFYGHVWMQFNGASFRFVTVCGLGRLVCGVGLLCVLVWRVLSGPR